MSGADQKADSQLPVGRSDKEYMEQILREEDVGTLGLAARNEPYALPVNYCYDRGRVLFHCALEGKKLDIIRKNPKVCFVVSRQQGRPTPHAGDLCNATFESVILYGVARIVDGLDERRELLNVFQERFVTPSNPRGQISIGRAAKCGCVEIVATEMTGRRRAGSEKAAWRWCG